MPMPVISNASPLIALAQVGRLDLLQSLFGRLMVPPAVVRETSSSVVLPAWIDERRLTHPLDPRVLRSRLGDGEREAISLALELPDSTLLLDDLSARRLAQSIGVPATGTLGILLLGKRRGFIGEVRPYLDALLAVGFFVAPTLYEQLLADSGESL
jgi:predicted nucleic acid-binding protein